MGLTYGQIEEIRVLQEQILKIQNSVKNITKPEIKETIVKCPNQCYEGQVKVLDAHRALFSLAPCRFCKGTGEVSSKDYDKIDNNI